MSNETELFHVSFEASRRFEWIKWANKIPYLRWPPSWKVKAVPPMGGAIVRYWIKAGDDHVSVYLDCYGLLGAEDKPYWEVYPVDGDVARFAMDDTHGLIACISKARRQMKKGKK